MSQLIPYVSPIATLFPNLDMSLASALSKVVKDDVEANADKMAKYQQGSKSNFSEDEVYQDALCIFE